MQIPDSWKDITIGRFMAAYAALQAEYESESDIDKEVAFCAAITDSTEDDILRLPIPELKELITHLQFVADLNSIGTKFPKWFTLGGTIYKPLMDLSKATAGQYVDFVHFANHQSGIINNLHNLLAVLCVPWFRQYDGGKHLYYANYFKENLSMAVAYPMAVFFCNLLAHSTPAIQAYFDMEAMKIVETAMNNPTSSLLN